MTGCLKVLSQQYPRVSFNAFVILPSSTTIESNDLYVVTCSFFRSNFAKYSHQKLGLVNIL